MAARRRRASHAGSWYSASAQSLRRSLKRWLEAAATAPHAHALPMPGLRAVIAPHAGYSYSGRISAYAHAAIPVERVRRVFVLGPAHHVLIRDRCALSGAGVLETPLGDLPVDVDAVAALYAAAPALFEQFGARDDEDEHSIEMHLPFIRHVFGAREVKVVPVVVGSLSEAKEIEAGRVLAPWLADPETFFIVSSDFCHWGAHFDYVRYEPADGEIWQSIEKLDRKGMDAIETGEHARFTEYQRKTENTICGRHAIGAVMVAMAELKRAGRVNFETKFVKYDQSSKCESHNDTSVSYAAAWSYLKD